VAATAVCPALGGVPKPLDAVEQQVESELKLELVVAPAQRGVGVVGDLHQHRGDALGGGLALWAPRMRPGVFSSRE
jgi:hypothetical protein